MAWLNGCSMELGLFAALIGALAFIFLLIDRTLLRTNSRKEYVWVVNAATDWGDTLYFIATSEQSARWYVENGPKFKYSITKCKLDSGQTGPP